MQKISILVIFLALILWLSCTRDVAPEITCDGVASYDKNIKMLIETTCVYSACHDGSPGVPGVFFEYEDLKPFIDNGTFEAEVTTLRTMPPPDNINADPKELTQDQLDLFICWIAEGYPIN